MFQPDLLKGKRILITGGGTGLGLSMGRRFLELGADLVICGRREAVLQEAAAQLKAETKGSVETASLRHPRCGGGRCDAGEIWKSGRSMHWSTMPPEISSPGPSPCRRARVDAVLNIVLHGSAY